MAAARHPHRRQHPANRAAVDDADAFRAGYERAQLEQAELETAMVERDLIQLAEVAFPERLARLAGFAQQVLQRGAPEWRPPARRLLALATAADDERQVPPQAMIDEMLGCVREIARRQARWIKTSLDHARAYRRGGAPGRTDALGRVLRELLEQDPRRSGKDVWAALVTRAAGRDPTIVRLAANVVLWRPAPGAPLKKTSKQKVLDRLTRLRRSLPRP